MPPRARSGPRAPWRLGRRHLIIALTALLLAAPGPSMLHTCQGTSPDPEPLRSRSHWEGCLAAPRSGGEFQSWGTGRQPAPRPMMQVLPARCLGCPIADGIWTGRPEGQLCHPTCL